MERYASLDALVRQQLRKWPQHPPGLWARMTSPPRVLRGRPADAAATVSPFLKIPGTDRLKTLPDGMWLQFGGTPEDPWCDVVAVEACSSFQNLLDKRSRFAPSTHSLLAVCPLPWLLAPATGEDATPRWRLTGVLKTEPTAALTLPVRDIRVLYGLKEKHYEPFARSQVPHAHEFFCPMGALTAERGYEAPAMRALMMRLTAAANFFGPPDASAT
ncbi:hypothetical protein FK498_06425 [Elioraea sp. Yellowstone]|jgi:hypothetical protein|uniref:hypothetical protein n=1 Tax=Elioraea sp. Yellowstone TaxID=2592070 RepID=UPI00114FAC5A|nr:hypothetical protein [Elioraea sp. Yellowstone]TQF80373.1 hypothetical protein FK498_06425 [Elioraea sp. Yellowstone]